MREALGCEYFMNRLDSKTQQLTCTKLTVLTLKHEQKQVYVPKWCDHHGSDIWILQSENSLLRLAEIWSISRKAEIVTKSLDLNRSAFYRAKPGKNRKTTSFVTTVRDCKSDEGLSRNILFADAKRRQEEQTVTQLDERPLMTHARELQKGCYCRSVSAILQSIKAVH